LLAITPVGNETDMVQNTDFRLHPEEAACNRPSGAMFKRFPVQGSGDQRLKAKHTMAHGTRHKAHGKGYGYKTSK
jgi:hypothetical protein